MHLNLIENLQTLLSTYSPLVHDLNPWLFFMTHLGKGVTLIRPKPKVTESSPLTESEPLESKSRSQSRKIRNCNFGNAEIRRIRARRISERKS